MPDTAALSSTMEDYLEAISRLVSREGAAHVKDIAETTSVHMSTVTTALHTLAEKGLVNYRPYEAATLTEEGKKVADRIVGRHEAISDFLSGILLVDEEVAEENACRMEHVLDREVVEHLSLFGRFVKECPRAGEDWLDKFRYFLEHDGEPPKDEQAIADWLHNLQKKLDTDNEGDDRVTTLDELESGQEATIVKVGGTGSIRRRMVDMGAVKGTTVEVVKVAPLGDPMEVKIKGYNLTLRKKEAANITVDTDNS